MKSIKNIKRISLMLVLAVLICGWAVTSLASSNVGNTADIFNIEDRTNNRVGNTNTNTNTNTNQQRNNVSTVNTNTNTNTNSTLPKTGVNDTAMWILVVICGVATVYTYKKVRDYNV